MKTNETKPNVPANELSKRAWVLARELSTEAGDSPKVHYKQAYEIVKVRALEMPKPKRSRSAGAGRKNGMGDQVVARKLDGLYEYAQKNYCTWGQYVTETVDRKDAEAILRSERTTMGIIKTAKAKAANAREIEATAF